MKTNKLSNCIYSILILLPFVVAFIYMIIPVFSHTFAFTDFSFDSYISTFSGVFSTTLLDWCESVPLWTTINDFISIITNDVVPMWLCDYLTYSLTISLVYLGYEVLLAFIQIVRKLVYAFVDKEF